MTSRRKGNITDEGATTGVTGGGVVGGTLVLLAGIGALAIPGVGPFVAAGPIMGALAGLGVGGAVGGLVGALVGMGIPEYEAKRYEGRIKDGGVLLSVHCDTSAEIDSAKEVLEASGAEDISSAGEKSVSTHGLRTKQAMLAYLWTAELDWEERPCVFGRRERAPVIEIVAR
jgi:hypothetical protein